MQYYATSFIKIIKREWVFMMWCGTSSRLTTYDWWSATNPVDNHWQTGGSWADKERTVIAGRQCRLEAGVPLSSFVIPLFISRFLCHVSPASKPKPSKLPVPTLQHWDFLKLIVKYLYFLERYVYYIPLWNNLDASVSWLQLYCIIRKKERTTLCVKGHCVISLFTYCHICKLEFRNKVSFLLKLMKFHIF